MKTSAATAPDLARSVIAVPPLSNIGADHHGAIRAAARALLAHDRALARTPAAVGTT